MKTGTFFKQLFTSLSLGAILLISCSKDDDDENLQPSYSISGDASGSQVVPSIAGTGTGGITGTYNPNSRMLTYTTNWSGLTGAPNSGGFYNGASGAAGTAIGTGWTFDQSTTTSTGSRYATMPLTSEQEIQLVNGNWYYSYGTTANPNGEVRGQVTATR